MIRSIQRRKYSASLAIYLRRSGHHITHLERNDPPVARGAGMLLHPAAMRELDKLGAYSTTT
jgi:2-polyprenyl-6-methoxyphenol hydroxylase-like FAD-dependent oxidoreductase